MQQFQRPSNLIFPRVDVEKYFDDDDYSQLIIRLINLGVGGFCIFSGSPEQVKKFTNEAKSIAERNLIFCADFEYGLPMRLKGGTGIPHHFALGKVGDMNATALLTTILAKECLDIGVDWNFAPVADINSNPNNPIINIRSFGTEPELVSKMASAYTIGLQNMGIAACAKHFPGHGDTNVDSHLSLPTINKSLEELEKFEIVPFKNLVKNNVKSIMVGHLSLPNAFESVLPSSLNQKVYSYLSDNLNYNGILVTDALDMHSISKEFTSGQATYLALKAGATIALMPENPFEAIDYINQKYEDDFDLKSKIDKNLLKLSEFRHWLDETQKKSLTTKYQALAWEESEKIALQVALKAIEMDKNTDEIVNSSNQIAAFAFLQSEKDFASASMMFNLLSQAYQGDLDYGFIDDNLSDEDLNEFKIGVSDAELVLFVYFYKSRAFDGSMGDYSKINSIVNRLAEGRAIVNVFVGNPYMAEHITGDKKLFSFSDNLSSLAASIMKLTGRTMD